MEKELYSLQDFTEKGNCCIFLFFGLANERPRGRILKNYSLKKSNTSITNELNTQIFIKKNLPFKVLKECPGALVSILLFF